MIWQEFIVNRNLSEYEIKYAIAKVFGITLESILIVNDITTIEVDDQIRVACERIMINGDFLMKISIYLRDEKLIPCNDLEVLGRLCDLMKCQFLIPDESVNPYQWLLVQDSKTWQTVYLDPVKLDENEEFCIQRVGEIRSPVL